MGHKILLLAAVCCTPSIFYLAFILGRKLHRWVRRNSTTLSIEDITQLILVMVSIICFGLSLLLVVLNFMTPLPFFHREKSLIIALLFLLMGILCVQVFQFVRWQSRQRSAPGKPRRSPPVAQKRVIRGYVVSNQKN